MVTKNEARKSLKEHSEEDYEGGEGDDEESKTGARILTHSSNHSGIGTHRPLRKYSNFDASNEKSRFSRSSEANLENKSSLSEGSHKGTEMIEETKGFLSLGRKLRPSVFRDQDEKVEENKNDNTNDIMDEEFPETGGSEQNLEGIENQDDPPRPEEGMHAEFKKFNKNHQQMVVDLFFDRILELKRQVYTLPYHVLKPEFVPETYNITPEEITPYQEELHEGCKEYIYGDNLVLHDPKTSYRSQIQREMFQVGIWKFDNFGVGRILDRYFTPKHPKVKDPNFGGFWIQNSLDFKNILLVEQNTEDEVALVVVLDAFTLKITSEVEVRIEDEDFVREGFDEYYDEKYDDMDTTYLTAS